MKNFKNKNKAKALKDIVSYLVEEDFPIRHLKSIQTLVSLFNWSSRSEEEIFSFIEYVHDKYKKEEGF